MTNEDTKLGITALPEDDLIMGGPTPDDLPRKIDGQSAPSNSHILDLSTAIMAPRRNPLDIQTVPSFPPPRGGSLFPPHMDFPVTLPVQPKPRIKGMTFARRFTVAGVDPYASFTWERRESQIFGKNADSMTGVEVPAGWSKNATDVLAQKYFRRAGVPLMLKPVEERGVPSFLWRHESIAGTNGIGGETSAKQVFDRLAGCWTYWGWKAGYFASEEDARAFYDELRYTLAAQMWAPNSPQWFNTGLHWAYGIDSVAQGHYYVDPFYGKLTESQTSYHRPQTSACFIQSVKDDLVNEGGIMDLWTREARLFKYGSGTGSNFSFVRGENEKLGGGGRSSGLMSFLTIGDRGAGSIKSGGTTRRAAKMVIVDADHPEVEAFIDWKANEEQKVAALVAGSKACRKYLTAIYDACAFWRPDHPLPAGGLVADVINPRTNPELKRAIKKARRAFISENYIQRVIKLAEQGKPFDFREFDTDWDSEAYRTVSGQNSNNTVSLSNAFLDAVEADADWNLIARTTGEVVKTVKARDVWERMALAAWNSADPGLHFNTTMNEWHTCPESGPIRGSNPCSEYMFLDDTACNLASVNLVNSQRDGKFCPIIFEYLCRMIQRVLEISVMMSQFPSKEIAQRSYDFRTTGLGYANLGALLMMEGVPYDSEAAATITGAITALMTGAAYSESAKMAEHFGAFSQYPKNRDSMIKVIKNHRMAAYGKTDLMFYTGLTILPKALSVTGVPSFSIWTDVINAARATWDHALEHGRVHGFRNAQTTVIAPTGTIGLVMDCDTTGIEPDFAPIKWKQLAGGGMMKIFNRSVEPALANLGYSKAEVQAITKYALGHGTFSPGMLARLSEEVKVGTLTADAFETAKKEVVSAYTIGKLLPYSALGFSEEEIEIENIYVTGAGNLEGAPHLKPEHLAVFDCANKAGKNGTRFISASGHIRIMAAAQPFVSGAISKTINMPYSATVDDIKNAYFESWRSGLKANAVYRDCSKLSQPLNSADITATDDDDDFDIQEAAPDVQVAKAAELIVHRLARRQLPDRRKGYTQKAKIGGQKMYLRTGEYEDGTLGEIFIDMNKEGANMRSMFNQFSIALSIGLQHGVPLQAFVDAFTGTRFEPAGPVQGNDCIKMTTSPIDYVMRELAISYLGQDEWANIPPKQETDTHDMVAGFNRGVAPMEAILDPKMGLKAKNGATITIDGSDISVKSPGSVEVTTLSSKQAKYEEARAKGYTGDTCSNCGAATMVRNGTCLKCDSCGSTTGCS